METLFFSRCHNDKTNLSEYALYKWHHPEGNVSYDTSDLVVACESDPDRFVTELKSEGDSPTLTGSKYDPVVSFTVPANTSTDDREWKIFVSGTDCRQSVVQRSMYTDGQTTWARGNIVLKDSRFAIGSPTDFGLFFRFNSIYGLPSDDPKAWMYQNIAYNPDQVTIQWKDMPYDDDSDPCGLADPAGTWRLPTKDEIESLSGTVDFSQPYDYNYGEMNGVFVYKYAEGKLIMLGGGVLYGTYGTGMARYYWKGEGYIRSGTPCYAMKGHLFRDRTTIVELLANRYALPVRCVRQQTECRQIFQFGKPSLPSVPKANRRTRPRYADRFHRPHPQAHSECRTEPSYTGDSGDSACGNRLQQRGSHPPR